MQSLHNPLGASSPSHISRREATQNALQDHSTTSTPQHPPEHHETLMDEDEWVYAWEEDLVDEDGQLWVVTMLSTLVLPFYEEIKLKPLLLSFLEISN